MSYNAGSIDSRLTLDRSQFSNELKAAKVEAREFSRNPIKLRLELDRARADAELRAFEGRVAIATRTRTTEIKVDTRTSDQRLRDLQNRINGVPQATRKAAKESEKDFNLMRGLIEGLIGPATVLAGGLGAMGAGLVAMAATGAVAVKALNTEYKTTSTTSQALHGDVVTLKGDWASLQHVVAQGVTPALTRATSELHAAAPAVQSLLGGISGPLGNTVEHVINGLVGGLQTFRPLIMEVARGVDSASAGFERWATGAGGDRFMHTLQDDLHQTVAFLKEVGPALSGLLSGINTFGSVGLGALTGVLHILNALDKVAGGQLFQSIAIGYLAFRTAVMVTAPINAAAAALQRFAVAETEAAAAGGVAGGAGLAGRFGGFLKEISPYIAGAAAAVLAANAASHATNSWAASTDGLKYSLHTASAFLSSMPWNAVSDLNRNAKIRAHDLQLQNSFSSSPYLPGGANGIGPIPASRALNTQGPNQTIEAARAVRSILTSQLQQTNVAIAQATVVKNRLWAQYMTAPKGPAIKLADGTVVGHQESIQQKAANAAYQDTITVLAQLNQKRIEERRNVSQADAAIKAYKTTYDAYLSSVDKANSRGLATTFRESAGSGLSGTSQALETYTAQIQKNIEAEAKWTDVGKGNVVQLGKLKVSAQVAQAALDASGNSIPKAEALILAHAAALGKDQAALKEAQAEQTRINVAVGDAAAKYGLTTAQVDLYATAAGISAEMVAKGTLSQQQFDAAIGATATAIRTGTVTLDNWVAAVQAFNQAGDTAASRAQLIGAALISLNGDTLQYANQMVNAAAANQKMVSDFDQVHKGVINLKTGFIDYHNAGAAPVLQDLQQLQTAASQAAAATYQHEVATKGQAQAAKDATAVFKNDTYGALVAEHTQLGLTRGEAEKLADRYFNWPKTAETQIAMLGAGDTNSILNALGQQLSYLTGHPWNIGVNLLISEIVHATAGVKGSKNKDPRLGATGYVAHYANGDVRNGHVAQLARAGEWRVWAEDETMGEAYIPFANDWRRPRAKQITQEVAHKLGGVAYFASGGGNPPPGTEQGGFSGVTSGGSSGSKKKSGGSGSGSGSGSTKADTKWYYWNGRWYQGVEALHQGQAADRATGFGVTRAGSGKNAGYGYAGTGYATGQEAHNARMDALVGLPSASKAEYKAFDTKGELTSLAARSAASIQAAVQKISDTMDAARKARAVPASLVTQFRKDNYALNQALADRDKWAAKVKADRDQLTQDQGSLKQYGQQVTSTLLGGFDINTSGNGYAYGIQATLKQQIATISKMRDLEAQAQKMHLDPRLIQQLESQGTQGGANLEALVNGGQGTIDSVNSDYARLFGLATSGGDQAMRDNVDINKQIADDNAAILADTAKQVAAQAQINAHLTDIRNDTKAMQRDLASALITARKKA